MIKYEIMTEDLRRDLIVKMITKSFKGFSIVEQIGFWEGKQEKSVTYIIFADRSDLYLIELLCRDIKSLNEQDAVLMSVTYTDTKMI
jgi:hypothetical protein